MKLSQEQCKFLIDLAESGSKQLIRMRNGTITRYQTVYYTIDGGELKDMITQYCMENLNLDVEVVNVGILKYEVGDSFERHIDYGGTHHTSDFIYNINVLLNDEYEGGEFYLNDTHYPKPVGEVYHYKSNEYHEVKKITKGVRYSALFYIRHRDLKKNQNEKKNLI